MCLHVLVTWQACKQQTSASQVRWRQRIRFFCRSQARHVDVRLLPRRCALRTDVIRGPRLGWVGHPLSPSHCKSDGTAQSADILVACRVHSRSSGSCMVLGEASHGTLTTGAAIQQVAAGGLQRAQVVCSWDMHRQVAALPTGAAAACPGLWCSGLAGPAPSVAVCGLVRHQGLDWGPKRPRKRNPRTRIGPERYSKGSQVAQGS